MRKIMLATLLLIFILSPLGCNPADDAANDSNVGTQPGSTAPDFSLASLGGPTVQLSAFAGRPVLLNFFTTWCGYCKAEMPDLQAIHNRYTKDGLVVIGVDLEDPKQDVIDFASETRVSFTVLLDSKNKVGNLYGVNSYPRTFFIRPDGTINRVLMGSTDKSYLESYVGEILAFPRLPAAPPTQPSQTNSKKSKDTLEGCVVIKQLTVRDRPNKKGNAILYMSHDACSNFDARTADGLWVRLADQVSNDGKRLWASAEYFDFKGDINTLPVDE
jgi:cytochrome c biogenesis protein CcmG, thiol:disulfide interchange protein DsbE